MAKRKPVCKFSRAKKKGQVCKRVKGGRLLCCPKKRGAKKATKKRTHRHYATRAYYDSRGHHWEGT
jgi:hypothetical protein